MANTNDLYNAITDIEDKYILETESSMFGKNRKTVRIVSISAAAVIIIIAGIFVAGITASAAWDNSAFGYIRRLLDSNIDMNEYLATVEEISAYTVNEIGFIIDGEEYSTDPTIKELLIHGWEIADVAMRIGDIHENGKITSLIDSYYMTKGDSQICVCLNWDDLLEDKLVKDCRIGCIYLNNVGSFILDDKELVGISDDQLLLMTYIRGFCGSNNSIDILTGKKSVSYSYNIANDHVDAICIVDQDDAREIKVVFDRKYKSAMNPGTIINISDDKIQFGYRDEYSTDAADYEQNNIYEIPNSHVLSDDTPEVGDIIYIDYDRSAVDCIGDDVSYLDLDNCFVSRVVNIEEVPRNDHQSTPSTISSPELKMITDSGLLNAKNGWISETDIKADKELNLIDGKLYIRFDNYYYNYKNAIYFQAQIWQEGIAVRKVAWSISDDILYIDLNPDENGTDEICKIPYKINDMGQLVLEIEGISYNFINYDHNTDHNTEQSENEPIKRGPVSRKIIDGDIYAVTWDQDLEPEYIRDRCKNIWKFAEDNDTAVYAVEKPHEVKRPILDAIRNRKLYFVTELPVSELESAGSLEALVDEIIDIVNYDINGHILASSDGGGMLIGYCCHAETDEVKDTISLYITFVYNYDPWKSLDSSISDPGEMLAKIQTSMDFRQWIYVFAFMPMYQTDKATELVSSIIDNGRYYGYFDMFPDSVITGSCEFYESEMRWFIENVFHVDPEAYKTGLDQYLSKYPERYNNGIIYGMVAGAPVNEVTTVIDEVEYDGKYWHMKGHDHYLYDNTDMFDHSFSAVMEISQTDTGQLYWSIYSFSRDN